MGVIKHDIKYGDILASDKQIVIYGGDVDEIAARDVTSVAVPGRNGVLHLDNGRWTERKQTYLAFITGDGYAARLAYARGVFGRVGKAYTRLEDTFNTDVYALATFEDALKPESLAFRTAGLCELSFNCRPERFLRTGEQVITTTSSVTLSNPTGMPARPLLRVYGVTAGSLTVGGEVVYIDAIDGYVDIDCDLCDCYKGAVNCNGDVRLSNFPVLGEGTTGVSISGGLTSCQITPRWWRL